MTCCDRFKFEITDFSGTTTELHPIYQSLDVEWKREGDELFYRKEIKSDLLFRNEDYDYLLALDNATGTTTCNSDFRVTDYCRKPSGDAFFEGTLSTKKAEYDCDSCYLKVSPSNLDEYSCLQAIDETEINILNIDFDEENVEIFIGEIECVECFESTVINMPPPPAVDEVADNCINANEGWTVVRNHAKYIISSNPSTPNIFENRTFWCREIVTGSTMSPTSDPLWIDLGGGTWVRGLDATLISRDCFITPNIGGFDCRYVYNVAGYFIPTGSTQTPYKYNFENGVKLEKIITALVEDCDLEICSNYFNINQDGTAPSNQAYNYSSQYFSNLIFFQQSDISNAGASIPAILANISLKELKEILARMFNAYIIIEESKLRIEHISYFSNIEQGLDLTEEKYLKYTVGKNKFQYQNTSLPISEKWEWANDVTERFESRPFFYNCGVSKATKIKLSKVNSDVTYISNPNSNLSPVDRFVILSTDNNNIIHRINGIVNGPLTWRNLQKNVLNYNRPFLEATFEDSNFIHESAQANKIFEEVTIPFCCEEYYGFNAANLVKNKLGNCEIETATYNTFNETLTLTLRI